MLKKAGIIATVATAGVLALAPLAFAGEKTGNLSNDCTFENVGGAVEQSQVGGSGGLLGAVASTFTGIATNATSQADTGNCTNVQLKDLVDSGSNNEDEVVTETAVEDSFNTED